MNIWIQLSQKGQAPAWVTGQPSHRVQMQLPQLMGTEPQNRFILRKGADGFCTLLLQQAENGLSLVIDSLSESQARAFAAAYLEQSTKVSSLLTLEMNAPGYMAEHDMQALRDVLEQIINQPVETGRNSMLPEWFRGNYSTDPACRARAAEYLRQYRLSAGPGVKVIIEDQASEADSSRADIILSACYAPRHKVDSAQEISKAIAIRLGVAAAAILLTWGVCRVLRK